MVTRVSLYFL